MNTDLRVCINLVLGATAIQWWHLQSHTVCVAPTVCRGFPDASAHDARRRAVAGAKFAQGLDLYRHLRFFNIINQSVILPVNPT